MTTPNDSRLFFQSTKNPFLCSSRVWAEALERVGLCLPQEGGTGTTPSCPWQCIDEPQICICSLAASSKVTHLLDISIQVFLNSSPLPNPKLIPLLALITCAPAPPSTSIPSCLHSGSPQADAKTRMCIQWLLRRPPRGSQARSDVVLRRLVGLLLVPWGTMYKFLRRVVSTRGRGVGLAKMKVKMKEPWGEGTPSTSASLSLPEGGRCKAGQVLVVQAEAHHRREVHKIGDRGSKEIWTGHPRDSQQVLTILAAWCVQAIAMAS